MYDLVMDTVCTAIRDTQRDAFIAEGPRTHGTGKGRIYPAPVTTPGDLLDFAIMSGRGGRHYSARKLHDTLTWFTESSGTSSATLVVNASPH